ncbi:MAG TPA: hypothetical protein VKD72_10940 [Gemmataceae bacterium]|nr:hypothetical protein [Gemmataceae bacterium]
MPAVRCPVCGAQNDALESLGRCTTCGRDLPSDWYSLGFDEALTTRPEQQDIALASRFASFLLFAAAAFQLAGGLALLAGLGGMPAGIGPGFFLFLVLFGAGCFAVLGRLVRSFPIPALGMGVLFSASASLVANAMGLERWDVYMILCAVLVWLLWIVIAARFREVVVRD